MIIFGILNLAKSSLRSRISSSAVHWADKTVKPQMSANNILTWALYNTIQYTQHTQLGIIVQVSNVGDGDCGGDGDDDEDDEQYMYSPMHDCDSDGDADEDWGKTN